MRCYADPPEGVHQTPAAIVLESNGTTARDGFRGLWERRSRRGSLC